MKQESVSDYLTSAAVRAKFGGVSHMWIFRKTPDEGFPEPVRFGEKSRRYWRASDIEKWERRTIRADVKGKRPTRKAA